MDWGLLTFTRDGRVLTRSRLLLPVLTYMLVTAINLALRFSWAINRVPGKAPSQPLVYIFTARGF